MKRLAELLISLIAFMLLFIPMVLIYWFGPDVHYVFEYKDLIWILPLWFLIVALCAILGPFILMLIGIRLYGDEKK